jgi:ketol-acid reductoisomerase
MDERTDYEQTIEGISKIAELVAAYYDALFRNGIEKELAQKLTISYQQSIMQMIVQQKK